jgi:hypothetical protein
MFVSIPDIKLLADLKKYCRVRTEGDNKESKPEEAKEDDKKVEKKDEKKKAEK